MTNEQHGIDLEFDHMNGGVEDEGAPDTSTGQENKKERESAATKVVQAVQQRGGVELFHDAREAYAAVAIDGHREVMAIRSRPFRLFVIRVNYELTAKIPASQSISDALALMEAQSLFDGVEHKVYVRVAPGSEDDFFLDLGDEGWGVVHVTGHGWSVVPQPPVYFRRPDSMRALPVPQPGKLDDLRQFLNVAGDEAFVLLKAFLVAAIRPRGPYPVAYIAGQQGTAKTTTCRVIRALLDPCKAEVRSAPHDEDDLLIAGRNSHLIALDNLSRLEPWLSDAMCRIATGGGLSKRQLYTDQDEIIIECQKPQVINAIEDLAFRGDFAERALTITLEPITEMRRRDEGEFWKAFESARPGILGGLLDAAALAIRQLPTTRLESKPRMADFALWATAAEPILTRSGGFMRAYAGNIRLAQEVVLEASLIAPYIIRLVDESDARYWIGTTKELLHRLIEISRESGNEQEQKDKSWPRTPHKLSGILRRLAVALLSSGIQYTEPDRHTKARTLQLKRGVGGTTAPKAPKAPPLNNKDLSGADVGADVEYTSLDFGTKPNGAEISADGAVRVPSRFQANGTMQTIENTGSYANGADGAVLPPVSNTRISPFTGKPYPPRYAKYRWDEEIEEIQ